MSPREENFGGVARQYNWSVVSPSVAVLETIAAYEEITVPQMAEELSPPLARVINTDALDRIVSTSPTLSLSFTFSDYQVHIRGNTVNVTSPETTDH